MLQKFEENLLRQEANLRETLNIGQDIMKRCHPDAVPVMKQWLSVLRARWEEVRTYLYLLKKYFVGIHVHCNLYDNVASLRVSLGIVMYCVIGFQTSAFFSCKKCFDEPEIEH